MSYKLKKAMNIFRTARGRTYPAELVSAGANGVTVEFVKSLPPSSRIAELGIYKGETTLEIAKHLNDGGGELHLFDFEEEVNRVAGKLRSAGFRNFVTFGTSHKYRDSYCWPLAKLIEKHREPIYDYVFIDGAHTFAIDALAALLSDRLLKVGGYLDFDDYAWTLAGSPTLNPSVFPLTGKLYTDEQITTRQVAMVVDLLIERDSRYESVVPNKIYRKIAA